MDEVRFGKREAYDVLIIGILLTNLGFCCLVAREKITASLTGFINDRMNIEDSVRADA